MLYQKLLVGTEPYYVNMGPTTAFNIHRHPEIEISYCISGSYSIVVNEKTHKVENGCLAVVNSMMTHEFIGDGSGIRLTIEIGPVMLGEYFEPFINHGFDIFVFNLNNGENELLKNLKQILCEIAENHNNRPEFYELSLKGSLYKTVWILLQLCLQTESIRVTSKIQYEVEKIEKALEIIYKNYYTALNIETVSKLCGYTKSNFCKIFKNITGETFHNMLNRHRIEIACVQLKETGEPIEKIAQSVGFADTKSFCRTFKTVMGETAGNYRKKNRI